MSGLEAMEVKLSEVKTSSDIFRVDSFFFAKEFLNDKQALLGMKSCDLISVCDDLRSFGAYSLNNDVTYQDSGIPFVRCVNMRNGFIDFSDLLYINEQANELLRKSAIKLNTVLLSMSGSVGNVAYAQENWNYPINSNQDIAKIHFKKSYNPYVAFAFMLSKYGQNFMIREARGSVQQHVYLSQIEKMRLPIFCTVFCKAIERTVQQSHKARDNAEFFYKSAESRLLTDLGLTDFTASTEPVAVKSFADSFGTSGRLDAEYYQQKYEDYETAINTTHKLYELCDVHDSSFVPHKGEYKYIELADIGAAGNITGCTSAPFEELPSRARRLVKSGQVIVSSIEGSLSSCALVTEDYNGAICSTGFYVVDSTSINSETLLVLFKSEPIQQLMKKRCSGTILTAISKTALETMPFPLICDDKQNEVADLVKKSFILRRQSEQFLERAKRAVEIAIEDSEEKALKFLKCIIDGRND
jgi:restriction endonuclease S subunit